MKHVHYHSIGSTNDAARRLAQSHPCSTVVVSAGRQTAGRGRLGRTWLSPRGGVWMSVVQPLPNPEQSVEWIAPAVGLAVHQAINAEREGGLGERLQIKWPNDVLIDGRKVAGVLCERSVSGGPQRTCPGEGHTQAGIVIGIGINADFPLELLEEQGLRRPAATLSERLRRRVDPDALRDRVIGEVVGMLRTAFGTGQAAGTMPLDVHAAIEEKLAFRGERVSFMEAGRERTGVLEGIDVLGRALVHTGGVLEARASGEVDGIRATALSAARGDTDHGEPT